MGTPGAPESRDPPKIPEDGQREHGVADRFDDARHLAIAFAQLIARHHEDNGPYERAGERRDQEWTKGHPADPCGDRNQGPATGETGSRTWRERVCHYV